jgi:hypothetical protein
MFTKLFSVFFFISTAIAQVTVKDLDEYRNQLRPLLDALATVESNNNDDAVGDAGKALGRYQIWKIYWQDAVEKCSDLRRAGYECVQDKVYAERILVAYMLRYAKKAIQNKDFEKLSRIHNGGPRGHTKDATIKYWNKVNKILQGKSNVR